MARAVTLCAPLRCRTAGFHWITCRRGHTFAALLHWPPIRAAARCIRVSALASALSRSSWRSCSRGSRLVNRGQAGRPGKRSWIPMADSMRSATPALARRIAVQILGWSKLWIARSGDPWPDRALVSTTDECALDAEGRPRFRLLTTRDPDLSVNT